MQDIMFLQHSYCRPKESKSLEKDRANIDFILVKKTQIFITNIILILYFPLMSKS